VPHSELFTPVGASVCVVEQLYGAVLGHSSIGQKPLTGRLGGHLRPVGEYSHSWPAAGHVSTAQHRARTMSVAVERPHIIDRWRTEAIAPLRRCETPTVVHCRHCRVVFHIVSGILRGSSGHGVLRIGG
jgi:hypothetical protein